MPEILTKQSAVPTSKGLALGMRIEFDSGSMVFLTAPKGWLGCGVFDIEAGNGFGMAMALSLAIVAIAGVFLAVRANFDPAIGPARLIFGFEAVIIGGLGSMWGTLAGGVILGVSQAIGAQIDPGWQLLAGHLAFLAILAVRPQGLFPKVSG